MRYRKKFRANQPVETFAGGFICSLLYPGRSLLTCLRCGLAAALGWWIIYFFWYWEIRDDCLVQRHLFRRIAFPLSDITYVGPMKGAASGYEYFDKHILIETVDGKRMFAQPADPEDFLANMRKYVPLITLNL
jgi:hypothetical protein